MTRLQTIAEHKETILYALAFALQSVLQEQQKIWECAEGEDTTSPAWNAAVEICKTIDIRLTHIMDTMAWAEVEIGGGEEP